ncbi:MAG: hypothetical protein AAF269_04060 [Pseudomonadota bacterium]
MTSIADGMKFTLNHTTRIGNVSISETSNGWFNLEFQDRYGDGERTVRLGTYPTVQAAIAAVKSGEADEPDSETSLSELEISEDPNDWDHHYAGRAS